MDIITLIQVLVSGLLNAQEEFLEHLDQFSTFEETVNGLTDQVAADFIGLTLTAADTLIRESGKRKAGYTVQRSRNRTLISGVGDITFTHDSVQMAEQLMKDVTDAYLYPPQGVADESGHMQLKALADEFSMTPLKVRKLLITAKAY